MKIILVENLKGTEKLSFDVCDNQGRILIKAGTILTKQHINKLHDHCIFSVKIDGYSDNYLEYKSNLKDEYMESLKNSSLKNIPIMFDKIVNGNFDKPEEYTDNVYSMVDHILEEGSVNTNLFEIKSYDDYTYIHCVDTCIMAVFLGSSLHLPMDTLRDLSVAAILHDIGKTKISNSIITKQGKLTNEEFAIIKNHTLYGEEILSKISSIPQIVVDSVGQHHEKFNGKGYPRELSGDQINIFARIISICDVFTAVSANRSYRNRFNPYDAYELILSSAGTQFDPKLVHCFKDTFSVYPLGCSLILSNGLEGIVIGQNKGFPDRPIVKIFKKFNNDIFAPFELNLLEHINVTVKDVL